MYVKEMAVLIRRILVFGDDAGTPMSVQVIPTHLICGIVAAEIRPQQHASLSQLAEQLKVPFLIQPKHGSPDYPDFLKQIVQLSPDLIFVNSYSMLVQPDVLQIPSHGAINVHGALLPQYRGSNPIQWALLNDEQETGVTMHYMSEHFDEGDIIAQKRVPIYFNDTWRDIQRRIVLATQQMLMEEMPGILNGTNKRYSQDENHAAYYHRRHPEDGKIKWESRLKDIYNMIRALVKPHPGAYYMAGSDKIILDKYLTLFQIADLKYGVAGGQLLQSENLNLIPLKEDEVAQYLLLLTDLGGIALDLRNTPVPNAEPQKLYAELLERNDEIIFTMYGPATNEICGFCGLQAMNHGNHTARLQVYLSDNCRKESILFEAIRLLLDFGFTELDMQRVFSLVNVVDAETARVCEKLGFVREGLLRKHVCIHDSRVDVIVMGIMREEFYD